MHMPWWFWLFPGAIFLSIASIPVAGWALKRSGDPYSEGESSGKGMQSRAARRSLSA